MRLSDFDFDLPEELIAQYPLGNRDSSRMLVVDGGVIKDSHIKDFVSFLQPGDVVVFNNSRVIPARFVAITENGTEYEITLHTHHEKNNWWAFAKKFGKLKIGEVLRLTDGTEIVVRDKNDESGLLLEFVCDNVFEVLNCVGKMPLPPYMKRENELADDTRYQTVYAAPLGSMAAPTAGLHFTPGLLKSIEEAGARIVNITLHVGAGTWLPIKSDDTENHVMHSEWGEITSDRADIINAATRVIAVGTTSLRLLESASASRCSVRVRPFSGTTNIFITPGYKFRAVDVLLTNFHLPKSSLFMLVCAFAGTDIMKAAYAHAVLAKYRFFSYGDCCLLFCGE